MFLFSIVLRKNYLFLNSNGVIPTYRLKYLPKKERSEERRVGKEC